MYNNETKPHPIKIMYKWNHKGKNVVYCKGTVPHRLPSHAQLL